jgi:hypothetical protein
LLKNKGRDVFMSNLNNRRTKRVRNLMVICALTAVIISVSTYAWFIGMRTVNVSSFEVEVAGTDSLLLSLDGERWDTTVSISPATLSSVYSGNTNNWGGRGLLPMSSIGEMDATVSRMKIFEKASLTASSGGYRLMASRVNNMGPTEQDGYVVFDLFVHNFSGTQYIANLDTKDEEAIYLTTNSSVKVALDGGIADTGIENSVRVAFAQIGRVAGTMTDAATITGITCEPDVGGLPSIIGDVTGICRTAQIWEPNDTAHVTNAISWYTTSCLPRKVDGTDVTSKDSYNSAGTCGTVADTFAYPTYAVSDAIGSSDNVDIYDGAEYNTYTSTTKLVKYPFFTDTMKDKRGTTRPLFMTFAPNSITKVRVYIYIEGQDVDNYDFASIGKKISVQFGFTKERFIEGDIGYTENGGPVLNPGTDTTKPVITLNGEATATVAVGGTYIDAGATATDPADVEGGQPTDLTTKIQTVNPVDTSKAGVYTITYNVSDWAGNYAAQVTRTVTVTGA